MTLSGTDLATKIMDILGEHLQLGDEAIHIVYYLIIGILTGILAIIADKIAKKVFLKYMEKVVRRTKTQKDEKFFERKVFHTLVHYFPMLVLYLGAGLMGNYSLILRRLIMLIVMLITLLVIFRSLDAFNDIYMEREFAKSMPIKGLLQIVKIVTAVFTVLVGLVSFNETGSAVAILGSLGGMSAVILLIFKDSILGFVAGIQLSTNKFLSIGDWIEMPKYNADGEVIDVSLTKISVKNWDKTVSHIPAYKFIEEAFVNWDDMTKSGGRRIKRNLLIDVNSIGFLTTQEIENLQSIELLNPYLKKKKEEISRYNEGRDVNSPLNLRKLTNIGTFRAYIEEYLLHHPHIKTNDTLLVRQMEARGMGLPIQLYCFTNDTRWAYYEGIQSDIFDHLYAIIGEFGLRVYQEPAGSDLQKMNRYE